MRSYLDNDVQVTGLAISRRELPFAREANLGAGVDASRDADANLFLARNVAAPGTLAAGFFDYATLAIAARTGGHVDDLSEN